MQKSFQIGIVGGGVNGLSLACAIGNPFHKIQCNRVASKTFNIKIALIDSNPLSIQESLSNVISNRVVSLTPASQSFLDKMGAWKHVDLNRVFPYKNITVWDGISNGILKFDENSHVHSSHLASMIELQNLQQCLLKRANELSDSITILDQSTVESIQKDKDSEWPIVYLKESMQVECQLLVGADGGQSKVRQYADIPSLGWDYKQKGIVATLALQNDPMDMENTTAWQRFLPTGTIALLPLGSSKCSLVWSVSEHLCQHLMKLEPKEFIAMVNAAIHNPWTDLKYLFSEIQKDSGIDLEAETLWRRDKESLPIDPPYVSSLCTPLASFPLRFRQSPHFGSYRVALIGDAAHTIHPLAGQGLNMGLMDADKLSKSILKGNARGQDVGDALIIQEYTKQATVDNLKMGLAIHSLHHLFWNESQVLSTMRSLGLNVINKMDSVKSMFSKFASGL